MSEPTPTILTTMRNIAKERNKTMAQVALNWIFSHQENAVAISGSDTIEQLEDNLGALGWKLNQNEIAQLNKASSASIHKLTAYAGASKN